MTFLETLQSHKGSLIRLKAELYWRARGYEENPGRICLLLDVAAVAVAPITDVPIYALLLIDGSPQWVWLSDKAIEILVNDQAAN